LDISSVLERLCLAPAPTGYEKEVASVFKNEIERYTDRVKVDRLGNTIATLDGSDDSAPVVMVFAHLDTLGFMVRRIEPDGFIQIDRVGGIPEKVLPALRISIRNCDGEFLPGIIGNKAHHASSADDKSRVDAVTSLFVDVGAKSEKEVEGMGIKIGCPAIYRPHYERWANNLVSGTALDNRGGVAAMVLAAKLLSEKHPASTTHFVGSVFEEFNIRGAVTASRLLKPDIAICLDVILAGDTPEMKGRYNNKLGAGPAMNLYTFHGRGTLNGTLPHEGLIKLMERSAEEDGIPLQRFASLGMLTDSAYVQVTGQGVACLDLGFPTRYTHSPVEVSSLDDIENLGRLVASGVSRIDSSFECGRFTLD